MKKLKLVQLAMTAVASVIPYGRVFAIESIDLPTIGLIDDPDINIVSILAGVTNWVLGLAGAIAVLYLIWGGITYITGGEKGATAGKTMITNAIIGIAIIALSVVIVRAVLAAIGA